MSKNPIKRLGVISALAEEQAGLTDRLADRRVELSARRTFTVGQLHDTPCVFVLSRLGKVAAAATTASLIERFDVSHVLFTGVAGGIHPQTGIGDIVLADELMQHDMNAEPLFPRHEIPLLGKSRFGADGDFNLLLQQAVEDFLLEDFPLMQAQLAEQLGRELSPRLHRGLIASGDEFVNSARRVEELRATLPDLLAVEMEGAAVAQVCEEFGKPFAVLRSISDRANDSSHLDFSAFVRTVASPLAFGIVTRLCQTQVSGF